MKWVLIDSHTQEVVERSCVYEAIADRHSIYIWPSRIEYEDYDATEKQ